MAISFEDKQAIDEAVAREYWVDTDERGNRYIEIFADYRDSNEGLLQIAYDKRHAGFEADKRYDSYVYEPQNEMLYALQDQISEWYDDTKFEMEANILRAAGFDPYDELSEERLEYLREQYYISPPFDHFLNQTMRVNFMIGTDGEVNLDFGAIYDQSAALRGEMEPEDEAQAMEQETGLSWLIKQQGYSTEELKGVFQDFTKKLYSDDVPRNISYSGSYENFAQSSNKFLASVCQEIDNKTNYMNVLTVLAEISMKDFAELMQPGKEIVLSPSAMVGVFSPWNGGGSVLEIELEKDLVIPSEMIWDVQIEGAEMFGQYSVDQTYGLVREAWKLPVEVRNAEDKKIALSKKIRAAEQSLKSFGSVGQDIGRDEPSGR